MTDPALPYHHRQPGWLTVVVFLMAIALLLGPLLVSPALGATGRWILIVVTAVVVACLVVFSSLTIEVRDGELRWHFGPGWPRWRVPLSEIAGAEPARTSWWWGYGIRLSPHGWLYNVSGREAVIVRRRDGRSFMLGTDQPGRLTNAIRSAIS